MVTSQVNNSLQPTIRAELVSALTEHARVSKEQGIKKLFSESAGRVNQFSHDLHNVYFDFSKTHITNDLIEIYAGVANDLGFDKKRMDLFSGEKINVSEDRSVLHVLLRDPTNHGISINVATAQKQAHDAQQQLLQQYEKIEQQLATREVKITDIIHVGIGGSSLGTQLLFEALKELNDKINIHFIANIDAHQLTAVLEQCDVQSTMVIGVSKTFTTAETLQNITSIGQWFADNSEKDYLSNVYAVTSKPENALSFGVPKENTVCFPEWVGGRYSVWSSVSLSAVLVLGLQKFKDFLAGAAEMDAYFYNTPVHANVCFIAAMMDHYYTNYHQAGSRAIFAYDYRMRSLVDYLQQLETESNGKDRQLTGEPVDQLTSPVVWGGVGTNVQHSVFQMLHQGTALIPSEFILVTRPDHNLVEHHQELLANGIAQTAALLTGQDLDTVKQLDKDSCLSELTIKAKVFTGERPSTTILLDKLNARSLGTLLAFYEHRTFSGGVLANINSYDQMGVELGKRLANQVRPLLDNDANNSGLSDFDASTQALIHRLHDQKS